MLTPLLIGILILAFNNQLVGADGSDTLINGSVSTTPPDKINSWLWNDTLHWLQIDPYHKVSVIVWMYDPRTSQSYVADILATNHNATIKLIGEPYLNCLIAYIPAIEVEKVATYPFITSLDSGTYPLGSVPGNELEPNAFSPWNATVFPDPPANTTLLKQTSEDYSYLKDKFEPAFWDKLQTLTVTEPERY